MSFVRCSNKLVKSRSQLNGKKKLWTDEIKRDSFCNSCAFLWESSNFIPANRIPAVLPCHIERMGGVCKEQSRTKRPRLPVMETGGAAVLWETPQALQSLSAAES